MAKSIRELNVDPKRLAIPPELAQTYPPGYTKFSTAFYYKFHDEDPGFEDSPMDVQDVVLAYFQSRKEQDTFDRDGSDVTMLASALPRLIHLDPLKLKPADSLGHHAGDRRELPEMCFESDMASHGRRKKAFQTRATKALCKLSAALP